MPKRARGTASAIDPARFDEAVALASARLDAPGGVYDPAIFIGYTLRIIEGMGGTGPGADAAARDLYDAWSACHHFTLYEEVPEVLRGLHAGGYTIGLISNTQRSLVTFEQHFELQGLFDGRDFLGGARLHEAAPVDLRGGAAPRGVEAAEAVMVGDSVPHDIAGALALGMRGILVARSGLSKGAPPERAGDPVAARAAGSAVIIRDLTTIEECRAVAALERDVWGYTDAEDVVPPPVLIVSVKRGGILLGAFDAAGAMKGFVYSIPSVEGRPARRSGRTCSA